MQSRKSSKAISLPVRRLMSVICPAARRITSRPGIGCALLVAFIDWLAFRNLTKNNSSSILFGHGIARASPKGFILIRPL